MDYEKEKGENFLIKRDKEVKVIKYAPNGDVEIQDIKWNKNGFRSIERLNRKEYMVVSTGEVKEYQFREEKGENGLRRSMKKLNQILKNNFAGAGNELFITLTAEKDVTDFLEMKAKFQQWWRKMKREYKDLEFVAILEKHTERDSWHIHTMVKAIEHKRLYIPNNKIEKIWGYGFTKTSRITSTPTANDIKEDYKMAYKDKITEKFGIDKVINYMCKSKTKEQIPICERCYYKSKGIKMPIPQKIRYDETRQQMGQEYKLKKQYTSLIRDAKTNGVVNKVKTEIWTKKQ